ncbi:hypothetical protein [Chloroflexus sp.]|uniref:hypothetical protein n=1 Tax=Chloroflexus sp. TaxID=1904827 RepID=UPI002610E353|nr:hypothetical protein [uncultured Chloroflexus sp.]
MTLSLRLIDINGPFIDPSAPVRNWSSFPFSQIDLPVPPYVAEAQIQRGVERAHTYLAAAQAQGYTGIVIDNLAHLVTFDQAPKPYYTPHSPYRLRALAYRAALAPLLTEAAARGMQVYVTSDMQWMTPELRSQVGPLFAGNPRLDELNQAALIDLFTALPMVSGVIIRIGETGGAHDCAGYTGHLIYHDVAAIRRLIATLLPVCNRFDRHLIMRTWTLGIGEAGDLLSSPDRYRAVFADQRDPHLLVSLKHTPADFFRLLPVNPTLGLPGPRQIVELQNRREYELFGLVPSGVVELHSAAIRRAAAEPRCVGIWAWNGTGGWGGGAASLGPNGWNLWTEASSAITAALAQQPAIDAAAFAREWFAHRLAVYGAAFADAVATAYLKSESLIEQGWYFGQSPGIERFGGIVMPSLLWIWWMRPTVALPVWVYLSEVLPDPALVIERAGYAAQVAGELADLVALKAPSFDVEVSQIVTSLRYLHDALTLSQATRALLLPLAAMARDGQPRDLEAETRALRLAIEYHQRQWGERADFPPLELAELSRFLDRWEQAPRLTLTKARLAARLIRLARRQQHRLARAGALLGLLLPARLRRQLLSAALPWLSRQLDLLPTIFFEAGPPIGEWAR